MDARRSRRCCKCCPECSSERSIGIRPAISARLRFSPLGKIPSAALPRLGASTRASRSRASASPIHPPGLSFLALRWLAPPDARVSDYANEKRWAPLGAEADATWIVDAQGQEITLGYFNAVLRDWARLGL